MRCGQWSDSTKLSDKKRPIKARSSPWPLSGPDLLRQDPLAQIWKGVVVSDVVWCWRGMKGWIRFLESPALGTLTNCYSKKKTEKLWKGEILSACGSKLFSDNKCDWDARLCPQVPLKYGNLTILEIAWLLTPLKKVFVPCNMHSSKPEYQQNDCLITSFTPHITLPVVSVCTTKCMN